MDEAKEAVSNRLEWRQNTDQCTPHSARKTKV